MHYLGADETKPAPLFVRVVNPSDAQKAVEAVVDVIKDNFGNDVLNPTLWHLVGAYAYSGPAMRFVQNVITLEREMKQTLTESNKDVFRTALKTRFGYSVDDAAAYLRGWLGAVLQGRIPETILKPWDYEPTSAAFDLGEGAQAVVKSITPLILGAVAIYALVSAFLPNLIGKVAHR